MGALSAALKAELEKVAPNVGWLLKLELPLGTRWYGGVGFIYSGTAMVDARVLSWGQIEKGVSIRQSALELPTVEVTIDDTTQDFTKRLLGAEGRTMRGSPATIYLASPNVAPASWYVAFAGRLDSAHQPSQLAWTLQLAAQDLPLRREGLPRVKINRGDWPDCHDNALNQYAPNVYGKISSAQMTDVGACPCLYVDVVGFRYLVCIGVAKEVLGVYVGGVLQSTGYSITNATVNGRIYTLVDFAADKGTAEITVDVSGMESNGTGGGTLYTNPADIVAHFIDNFVYTDYKSGAWTSSTMFNAARKAALVTYFADRGMEASVYLDSKSTGLDFINGFLESFQLKAWWEAGKIALGVEDPMEFSSMLTLQPNAVLNARLSFPTADLLDRVTGNYSYHPANSDFEQYLTVEDLQVGENAPDSLDLRYSPAFI